MSVPSPPSPGTEGLKAVADLAKQVIALGSALITATVAFADKFGDKTEVGGLTVPPLLGWSWIAYIASVIFAVWTMMAVTGSLNEIDRTRAETNPKRVNTLVPGALMLLAFLAGVICTAAAGWQAIG